jgi:hypothetical protein
VELPLERVLELLDGGAEEGVREVAHAARVDRRRVPDGSLLRRRAAERRAEAVLILRAREEVRALRLEVTDRGEERRARGARVAAHAARRADARNVAAERVLRDVDRREVRARREDVVHDRRRVAAELAAEVVEVLELVLLHAVLDERHRDLGKGRASRLGVRRRALVRDLLEERREVLADGCVDEDRALERVELLAEVLKSEDGLGDAGREEPEGVARLEHRLDVDDGGGGRRLDEVEDVVDHLLLRDEVEELRERARGGRADVLEFLHPLARRARRNDLRVERGLNKAEAMMDFFPCVVEG